MHGALLDPRISAPDVEAKWGQFIESKDPVKRRWIAHNIENQTKFMAESAKAGTFGSRFYTNDRTILGGRSSLTEATLGADIDNFTQQSIAMVVDVFERFSIDELINIVSMSGPSAFVHTLGFNAVEAYAGGQAGDPLNAALQIDYSDCPAECENESKGVELELSAKKITADCKRLQAKFSVIAEQDLQSQYGMSLSERLRSVMAIQMAREIQGEILAALVAGAGFGVNWASAIPQGTVYTTLDPKVYQSTLWDAIQDCDTEIFKSVDGRRGANWVAGSPDAMNYLLQLNQFSITSRDNVPRGEAGNGDIDEFSNFFGTANHRFRTYKFPFMQADTILLGVKSDAPQEQGFIHGTYVPLTDLGTFRDPAKACVTVGATTRYANELLRPGMYAKVTIT
tara:strand:- start:686 stop:1876 length:1191 start_codon:yes stop_codon:yes gene_type:complete